MRPPLCAPGPPNGWSLARGLYGMSATMSTRSDTAVAPSLTLNRITRLVPGAVMLEVDMT